MSGKRLTLPFRFASVKCGHTRMVMVVNQPNVVPLDRDVWTSYVLWSPHGERLVSYDGLTWPGTLSYDGVTWNLEGTKFFSGGSVCCQFRELLLGEI